MKKLTLVSLILSMILISCKERGEVRIMPEFKVLIYISTLENLRKAGVGKSPNQSFLFY